MARRLITAAAVTAALALPSGAAAATPAAAPAAKARVATAKLLECQRDEAAGQPRAMFRGWMRRVSSAHHMAMKFTLYERTSAPRRRAGATAPAWEVVRAPGLGVWRSSRTGVRRFAHRQVVEALTARSSYRVSIAFRWYDADGSVLKRATRRSAACRPSGLPSSV